VQAGELLDIDVVVPAYGRPEALDRCLASLGTDLCIHVVDDGSPDADAVATVVHRRGARLRRRATNAGPAAARNTGLDETTAPLIAFVDSDCTLRPADLHRLAVHFADPRVAAVAPRVRPRVMRGVLPQVAAARSPLDLGVDAAIVRPHGNVAYVPTTALIVRRSALAAVGGFDPSLRYGEDVDLAWRLVDAGWVVRYEPSVAVDHDEPTAWHAWFRRAFHYGTSAGPLACKHGPRLAGPMLTGILPLLSAQSRRLPAEVRRRVAIDAPRHTISGLVRWGVPLWWPALLLGGRRRLVTRTVVASVIAWPALSEWRRRRPELDPVRYVVAATGTDLAYGAGVWWGSMRARTSWPLRPRWRHDVSA
jgi:mycofactocin system glycosyltransferase